MDEESRYVVAANYTYDAWGKCTVKDADGVVKTASDFVGNINPYRYRGYYYDVETGLYYLQSRYYDAEVGRFINGDVPNLLTVFAQGLVYTNLYSYCNNTPVNNRDTSGYWVILLSMAIGAIFGIIIQYIIDIITNLIENKKNIFKRRASYWDYFTAGLSGAVAATGIGKMAAIFYSSITSLLTSLVNNNGVNLFDIVLSVALGAVCGLIGGSGANLKDVSGVISVSKKVLKTAISPKKIAMYTSKIKNAAISTIKNALRYVASAVASSLGGEAKKLLKGVFG